MFASSMDSPRESGRVAGTISMPMRFVWPYGGGNVFLSGSFTRWSELVRMTPVEGCPTVFQAICSLSPGYHQFKFFVDGEWRHDEHQPHVSGEYGIVNTVLLATEANFIPAISNSEIPGSNMDVDNEAFRRLVRITDGTMTEALQRISEADIQSSRHRISVFLSTSTVYELLPESGKVVALDVDLPVKQAFHILHEQDGELFSFSEELVCQCKGNKILDSLAGEQFSYLEELISQYSGDLRMIIFYRVTKHQPRGISVAPLWDFSRGQFVGVLSALDFILILRELGKRGSNLTEEELETHTISAWKKGKAYLNGQIDGNGRLFSRHLIHAGPYDNMKDVALKILQNEVATVPVLHSSSGDGSFPQLLHIASLCGILKYICRYFKHCSALLPILHVPICAIPIGTWVPKISESDRRPLAMLRPSASLSSALDLFVQAQVSSIPIVDDNDSLLDIYCRSDITALAKDRAYAHINLDEMTIHQALQLGQDSFSYYEQKSQRCHMCLRSDSLHKAMERLADTGVRRLIVVEAGSKRVEGIISLTDIFKFLFQVA